MIQSICDRHIKWYFKVCFKLINFNKHSFLWLTTYNSQYHQLVWLKGLEISYKIFFLICALYNCYEDFFYFYKINLVICGVCVCVEINVFHLALILLEWENKELLRMTMLLILKFSLKLLICFCVCFVLKNVKA